MTPLCEYCGAAEETWVPLGPDWPCFKASTAAGRIMSAGGRILAQRPSNRPREAPPEKRYRLTNLCLGGIKKTVTVHSMILMAHGDETYPPGSRPEGMEVSHKDDNPAHNCASNLCWEDHPTNEGRKPAGQHSEAGRKGNASRNRLGHDLSQMSQPVTGATSGKRRTARARARALGHGSQPPVTPGTSGTSTLRSLLRRVTDRKGTSVT
jgi:hypothetical protein